MEREKVFKRVEKLNDREILKYNGQLQDREDIASPQGHREYEIKKIEQKINEIKETLNKLQGEKEEMREMNKKGIIEDIRRKNIELRKKGEPLIPLTPEMEDEIVKYETETMKEVGIFPDSSKMIDSVSGPQHIINLAGDKRISIVHYNSMGAETEWDVAVYDGDKFLGNEYCKNLSDVKKVIEKEKENL